MKIGIVTTWFERGAAYVSKQYADLLEDEHEVFIYARGGEEYAIGNPEWDKSNVYWAKKYPMPVHASYIDEKDFKTWLNTKNLDVVFFNEQRWWQPVKICKELNIKTGAYIDYYTDDTLELFNIYDFLICNTKRHQSAFSFHNQCYYVPWGTDTELFVPKMRNKEIPNKAITYFHSAGMSPFRKGTDYVLKAFSSLSKRYSNCQLVIHSQVDLILFFPDLKSTIKLLLDEKKLIIINQTVSAPGIYYYGDVYVYPSRIDGIGLTIAEALSTGLPTITVDNAPMNEFISSPSVVAGVKKFYCRNDGYYWPMCEIDLFDLEEKMELFIEKVDQLPLFKKATRKYALEHLNWKKNKDEINKIFVTSEQLSANQSILKSIDKYDTSTYPMILKMPLFYSYLYRVMKYIKYKIL